LTDNLDVQVMELPLKCFGGLLTGLIPSYGLYSEKPLIVIQNAEKFYYDEMPYFLTHETIHAVLSELEGDKTSDHLDWIFPTNYHTRCLVDCHFARHVLWRKKFGLEEVLKWQR